MGFEKWNNGREIRRLALRAITYLRHHPGACDNVKGVSEFWIDCAPGVAEWVLRYLSEKGFVKSIQRNGQVLYARNPVFVEQQVQQLVSEIPNDLP
jgi:hypothetical protein